MKTKKLVLLGLLTAIALTIFMIEAQIPGLVPIPGIKLGLSNIVTVFAVFAIGSWEGAAVLFVRVFLGAVFSGQMMTLLYSFGGGLLAWLAMVALKRLLINVSAIANTANTVLSSAKNTTVLPCLEYACSKSCVSFSAVLPSRRRFPSR